MFSAVSVTLDLVHITRKYWVDLHKTFEVDSVWLKHFFQRSWVVFTNFPNLSLILVIKFMTFLLVNIGPNLVFIKHVLARTIFLTLF